MRSCEKNAWTEDQTISLRCTQSIAPAGTLQAVLLHLVRELSLDEGQRSDTVKGYVKDQTQSAIWMKAKGQTWLRVRSEVRHSVQEVCGITPVSVALA